MAYKISSALLAAIVAVAGPAFAQENAPANPAENAAETAGQMADSVMNAASDAAADAEAAAKDAANAAKEAMTGGQDASGEAAAAVEEAAAEAATNDAADAEAAPADAEPAAENAENTEAKPAAAAPEDMQVGTYYVKTTHSDWTIRCIKAEEGQPDPCELYQLLKDDQGNSVAEVTMIPLNQGEAKAGATVVAPLETDLVRGLGLKVDSAATRGYPFNFCAPVGCVSRMGFDNAGLNGLKRGNVATVSLLPFGADPEKPVELSMSLAGFTAAFGELETIAAEAMKQIKAQQQEAPAN